MHALVFLLVGLQGRSAEPAFAPTQPAQARPADDAFPLPLSVPDFKRLVLRFREYLEPVLDLPIRQTETSSCYGLVGPTSLALGNAWYLGYGLSAKMEIEIRSSGPGLPLWLSWYPSEGIEIGIGYDLLRMQIVGLASWSTRLDQ